MLKVMFKKIFTILRLFFCLSKPACVGLHEKDNYSSYLYSLTLRRLVQSLHGRSLEDRFDTTFKLYVPVSSIPARYHTFVEIDHEIISTVILLPSADLFKKGCCQLQAKVCAQITG